MPRLPPMPAHGLTVACGVVVIADVVGMRCQVNVPMSGVVSPRGSFAEPWAQLSNKASRRTSRDSEFTARFFVNRTGMLMHMRNTHRVVALSPTHLTILDPRSGAEREKCVVARCCWLFGWLVGRVRWAHHSVEAKPGCDCDCGCG